VPVRCSNSFTNHKPRKWKAWADAAAPPNLMAYLFAKDVVQQSLRLGFAGAWDYSNPDLAQPLAMIEKHCPLLLRSFVPPSERFEEHDDTQPTRVIEDAEHTSVIVDMKGFAADGTACARRFQIGKDVGSLKRFNAGTTFSIFLRDAFADGTFILYIPIFRFFFSSCSAIYAAICCHLLLSDNIFWLSAAFVDIA
jgi:hypothetical protein